jgi:uncharacterized protein
MDVFGNNFRYSNVAEYVKNITDRYDSGHGWRHIERVVKLSDYISEREGCGDRETIILAALIHDVGDRKFENGENISELSTILERSGVAPDIIRDVLFIKENLSFSASDRVIEKSVELNIVQDADRLDAIGAIGIARAFNYGGFKNREIYDPEYNALQVGDMKAYRNSSSPTINHFYEKLLLLKGMMNTETGKKLAEERHRFMELFLEQFYREWDMAE